MSNFLSDFLSGQSGSAAVIFSIAVMLLAGFLMTRVTKRLKLPNVTGYILAGILLGPYCLNAVPDFVVEGAGFLPDIALAFIAFSAGQYFRRETLRGNGCKVLVVTLFESLAASVLVFVLTDCILGLDLAFSAVLAALAAATAPASTMMTIRQTGAKGDFVDTLLQVVALDDVVGLVAYSVAIAVALASVSGAGFQVSTLALPILQNLLVMALGGLFGLVMKWTIQNRHSSDNRLIIAVALLFSFCGICAAVDISPLLGCMAMGTVYINLTQDDKLFKQLGYFSPPLLLLFFVRSGLSFDLGALLTPAGSIGPTPLLAVGVGYFAARLIGKYLGAFFGCLSVHKSPKVRNYLGLALVPQAGVAIGLAALGARTLGGETGSALETIILASSVLYELIGPGCAKLALYLSGSYSNQLEEIAPVEETDAQGEPKTQLELLIERIQKIQEELPSHAVSEEERAFTEAAEEQYRATVPFRMGFRGR